MGLKLFRKLTLWAGAAVCLSLLVALPTNAQVPLDPTNIHIDCGATPNCTGGTSAVINATLTNPTFTVTNTDNKATGELFLAVLVPSYGAPTGFSSGTLWAFLGLDAKSTAQPDFNAFASDSQQFGQTASTPTGFTVQLFDLGACGPGCSVSATPAGTFPAGTFFYAYLESASGTTLEAVNSSPITPSGTGGNAVPEPASMAMFGTGLLVLGGAIRRRWQQR